MSGDGKKLTEQLKNAPKIDILAIGALGLNIFAIYTMANIRDIQELLQPFATDEIMLIQLSAIVAGIYTLEYMGDDGDSHSSSFGHNDSSSEGVLGWLSGFLEHGYIGTAVDILSLATVFMGYQYIAENVGRNVSIFEVSLTPEVLAMQLSVLMMLNFGLFLIGDLMGKANK